MTGATAVAVPWQRNGLRFIGRAATQSPGGRLKLERLRTAELFTVVFYGLRIFGCKLRNSAPRAENLNDRST